MSKIIWNGDAVIKDAKSRAWQRVLAAGHFLKAKVQANVDIATAAVGPSKPGEYPHKVSGTLQKSIFVRKREDMIAVDVGTSLIYGVKWELTNRPYIRRTYAEQLGQIKAILDGRAVRTIEDVRSEAAAMRTRHQEQKAKIQERKKTFREAKQAERRLIKKAMKAEKREQKLAVKQRRAERKAATKVRIKQAKAAAKTAKKWTKFERKEKVRAIARMKKAEKREALIRKKERIAALKKGQRAKQRIARAKTKKRDFLRKSRRKRK